MKKLKLRTKIIFLLFILFISWIAILQAQSFKYPNHKEIIKRVNYLERVIQEPLNSQSEIMNLGYGNSEWMLFSYSFSTYAFTNLAIRDTSYKKQAVKNIKTSIERVLSSEISSSFAIESQTLIKDSLPSYSVLYLGHLNLMLGCYRLLSNDNSFNIINDNISKSLFQRYKACEFLNLESYLSSIWIPDNTVALASLKLHSKNTGSNYGNICKKWVEYAKANYIEKETGVLYSTINSTSGVAVEEPRGSMLGWSIMFIYQFDSEFAIELYQNYKKHFSKNYIIFRLFRERYDNKKTNMGDIDSGPIFHGFSIPANEFALSNALIAKDYKTAKKLERLINWGTKKVKKDNELKYKVRFVDMNISPMAEALVLHSLTITKWTDL
ncbi:MAG: hypothetical protein K9J13_12280 [Saprospiraceae bacterium]|nr:hypothetical protein [Saprospiraceae bacterium]